MRKWIIPTPRSPHPLVSSATTARMPSGYTPHTDTPFFRCVNCLRREITYWRKGRFLVRKWNSWESSGYRRRPHLFTSHRWIPQVTQVLMMLRKSAWHLTEVFKPSQKAIIAVIFPQIFIHWVCIFWPLRTRDTCKNKKLICCTCLAWQRRGDFKGVLLFRIYYIVINLKLYMKQIFLAFL